MTGKRKQLQGASSALRHDGLAGEEGRLIVNSYEDVADSEDEFHINRDKVLLQEGPVQKRQRIAREEGEQAKVHNYVL